MELWGNNSARLHVYRLTREDGMGVGGGCVGVGEGEGKGNVTGRHVSAPHSPSIC